MKVGFALPHQGPVATRENMRMVATEAEKMGYDSLWTNERLLVPVKAKTPYPGNAEGVLDEEYKTHLDHLTCMTYVSAITERIRLGVSVINLFNDVTNPILSPNFNYLNTDSGNNWTPTGRCGTPQNCSPSGSPPWTF